MPRKRFAIIFYKQVLHIHAAQLKKPVASFKIYPCFFFLSDYLFNFSTELSNETGMYLYKLIWNLW